MKTYRLLIVDDSKFTRQLLREFLQQLEHEVIAETSRYDEALYAYRTYTPDITIIGLSATSEESSRLLQTIMEDDPSSKIIVCCSAVQQALLVSAVKMGASGYLLKPFSQEDVQDCIGRHGSNSATALPALSTDITPAQSAEQLVHAILEVEEKMPPLQAAIQEAPHFPDLSFEFEPAELDLGKPKLLTDLVRLDHELRFTTGTPLSRVSIASIAGEPEEPDLPDPVSLEPEHSEPEPEISVEVQDQARDEAPQYEEEICMNKPDKESITLPQAEQTIALTNASASSSAGEEVGGEQPSHTFYEADLNPAHIHQLLEQFQQIAGLLPLAAASSQLAIPATPVIGERKEMTRTHMCNWSEAVEGDLKDYLVVCTEGENKLSIEMGSYGKKQTLMFTMSGFFELVQWLEDTIGRPAAAQP